MVATACEVRPRRARHHRPADPELHLLRGRRGPQPRSRRACRANSSSAAPASRRATCKRPELTAEKFIANPFPSDGRDPILYRSGDAVSLDDAGQHRLPRPHRRPGQDPRLPRRARRDRGEARRSCRASRRRPWCCARTTGSTASSPSWCSEAGVGLDRVRRSAAALRRAAAALHGPEPFRDRRGAAAPVLRQGRPQGAAQHAELAVAPTRRASRRRPRNRDRGGAARSRPSACSASQALPFDADFFTDLGGHSLLAARFVSAVRETPALASHHAAGRLRQALPAGDGRRLIERTGGAGAAHVVARPVLRRRRR